MLNIVDFPILLLKYVMRFNLFAIFATQLIREKMIRHYRYKVILKKSSGGFRFPVMEFAYRFNIKGSVKKIQGFEYVVEAEGEEANLAAFKMWLQEGPIGSPVATLVEEEKAVANLTTFDIA